MVLNYREIQFESHNYLVQDWFMFFARKLTINRKNITFRLTTVFLVILTLGNERKSVTLDPHLATSWADLRVNEGLFEGFTLDPLSGKSVPGVAEF